jgi:ankyrin repeat protein
MKKNIDNDLIYLGTIKSIKLFLDVFKENYNQHKLDLLNSYSPKIYRSLANEVVALISQLKLFQTIIAEVEGYEDISANLVAQLSSQIAEIEKIMKDTIIAKALENKEELSPKQFQDDISKGRSAANEIAISEIQRFHKMMELVEKMIVIINNNLSQQEQSVAMSDRDSEFSYPIRSDNPFDDETSSLNSFIERSSSEDSESESLDEDLNSKKNLVFKPESKEQEKLRLRRQKDKMEEERRKNLIKSKKDEIKAMLEQSKKIEMVDVIESKLFITFLVDAINFANKYHDSELILEGFKELNKLDKEVFLKIVTSKLQFKTAENNSLKQRILIGEILDLIDHIEHQKILISLISESKLEALLAFEDLNQEDHIKIAKIKKLIIQDKDREISKKLELALKEETEKKKSIILECIEIAAKIENTDSRQEIMFKIANQILDIKQSNGDIAIEDQLSILKWFFPQIIENIKEQDRQELINKMQTELIKSLINSNLKNYLQIKQLLDQEVENRYEKEQSRILSKLNIAFDNMVQGNSGGWSALDLAIDFAESYNDSSKLKEVLKFIALDTNKKSSPFTSYSELWYEAPFFRLKKFLDKKEHLALIKDFSWSEVNFLLELCNNIESRRKNKQLTAKEEMQLSEKEAKEIINLLNKHIEIEQKRQAGEEKQKQKEQLELQKQQQKEKEDLQKAEQKKMKEWVKLRKQQIEPEFRQLLSLNSGSIDEKTKKLRLISKDLEILVKYDKNLAKLQKEVENKLKNWLRPNDKKEEGSKNELHNFVKQGDLKALSNFLKKIENQATKLSYINEQDEYGKTPLHYAAQKNNGFLFSRGSKISEFLLKNHANPNILDNEGCTALHIAAQNGRFKTVTALLKSEVKIDHQDLKGDTALNLAAQNDNRRSSKLLLTKGGANPYIANKQNKTALESALEKSRKFFGMLVAKARVEHKFHDSMDNQTKAATSFLSLMKTAIVNKVPKSVLRALNKGYKEPKFDFKFTDNNNNNILHLAIINGDSELFNSILKIAPQLAVNFINHQGDTPLNLAVKFSHVEMARALIKAGANLEIRNDSKQNALDLTDLISDSKSQLEIKNTINQVLQRKAKAAEPFRASLREVAQKIRQDINSEKQAYQQQFEKNYKAVAELLDSLNKLPLILKQPEISLKNRDYMLNQLLGSLSMLTGLYKNQAEFLNILGVDKNSDNANNAKFLAEICKDNPEKIDKIFELINKINKEFEDEAKKYGLLTKETKSFAQVITKLLDREDKLPNFYNTVDIRGGINFKNIKIIQLDKVISLSFEKQDLILKESLPVKYKIDLNTESNKILLTESEKQPTEISLTELTNLYKNFANFLDKEELKEELDKIVFALPSFIKPAKREDTKVIVDLDKQITIDFTINLFQILSTTIPQDNNYSQFSSKNEFKELLSNYQNLLYKILGVNYERDLSIGIDEQKNIVIKDEYENIIKVVEVNAEIVNKINQIAGDFEKHLEGEARANKFNIQAMQELFDLFLELKPDLENKILENKIYDPKIKDKNRAIEITAEFQEEKNEDKEIIIIKYTKIDHISGLVNIMNEIVIERYKDSSIKILKKVGEELCEIKYLDLQEIIKDFQDLKILLKAKRHEEDEEDSISDLPHTDIHTDIKHVEHLVSHFTVEKEHELINQHNN